MLEIIPRKCLISGQLACYFADNLNLTPYFREITNEKDTS